MKTWRWMVGLLWLTAALGVGLRGQVASAESLSDDWESARGTPLSFLWGPDAAKLQRRFGPLDHGLLTVEISTQSSAQDDEYETLIQASWRGADARAAHQQLIFEGFGVAHASEFIVRLEAQVLVLDYPTGMSDARAQLRWVWSSARKRFERERTAPPPEVSALLSLLDHNKLVEAHEHLELLLTSARGILQFHEDLIFSRLLLATHRLSRARYEAGGRAEAAALLVALIASPPLRAATLRPSDDDFLICASPTASGGCEGGFNQLSVDGPAAVLLNDCALILYQGGYAHLAAPLLRQVLNQFPAYAAAHLNLADALWVLGEHVESRLHYRWVWDFYRSPGPIPPLPSHVLSRLGEDAQSPDHITDAAEDM
jgi:tetratricopeptide (TPR) repeat protein